MLSYTNIEQSRKLKEILPLETADGGWYGTTNPFAANTHFWLGTKYSTNANFPAWSLASLLEEIPEVINFNDDESDYTLEILKESGLYYLSYGNPLEGDKLNIEPQENFVDACVAMIEKLHELKML